MGYLALLVVYSAAQIALGLWIGRRVRAQADTGGFAMDVLTGIGFFVVVAVVLIAGVYVMKPEK